MRVPLSVLICLLLPSLFKSSLVSHVDETSWYGFSGILLWLRVRFYFLPSDPAEWQNIPVLSFRDWVSSHPAALSTLCWVALALQAECCKSKPPYCHAHISLSANNCAFFLRMLIRDLIIYVFCPVYTFSSGFEIFLSILDANVLIILDFTIFPLCSLTFSFLGILGGIVHLSSSCLLPSETVLQYLLMVDHRDVLYCLHPLALSPRPPLRSLLSSKGQEFHLFFLRNMTETALLTCPQNQ